MARITDKFFTIVTKGTQNSRDQIGQSSNKNSSCIDHK